MDSQQIKVVRRDMRLDGVQYQLTALKIDGHDYQGSWHCPKCSVGGTSKLTYSRPEGAIEWACNCASVHERTVHGHEPEKGCDNAH
jgi:hypothetical protein